MREVPIDDVFAAGLPQGMDPHDPSIRRQLTMVAQGLAWDQYRGSPPEELRFDPIDWLITRDPEEAAAFQPAHDCAACIAGVGQLRAYMVDKPDQWVAVGNMRYVEVWPE